MPDPQRPARAGSRIALLTRTHPAATRFREARDGRDPRSVFVEGFRLGREFLTSGLRIREAVIGSERLREKAPRDLAFELMEKQVPVYSADERTLAGLSDLDTPPGFIARGDRPPPWDPAAAPAAALVVMLDGLQSPANVGAIVRCAEAGGAAAVGVLPGSADPLSPKSLRASAGSAFRVPLFRSAGLGPLLRLWPGERPRLVVADASGDRPYDEADWRGPLLLIVGSEARGVTALPEGTAVERVRVPMSGRVESLNAAVASGILLLEARRRRSLP